MSQVMQLVTPQADTVYLFISFIFDALGIDSSVSHMLVTVLLPGSPSLPPVFKILRQDLPKMSGLILNLLHAHTDLELMIFLL